MDHLFTKLEKVSNSYFEARNFFSNQFDSELIVRKNPIMHMHMQLYVSFYFGHSNTIRFRCKAAMATVDGCGSSWEQDTIQIKPAENADITHIFS